MANDELTILVCGATGNQGGHLARALLERGHTVHALTRYPDSEGAKALRARGADVVHGDYDHPDGIERALGNVDAIYLVTTPEDGAAEEVRRGKAVVDAARAAGTPHLVFTSVASAGKETGVPFFGSKHAIERHIEAMDVPYTVLAPVFFMENALGPLMRRALADGEYALPLSIDRPLQQVALTDNAACAVTVIERRGDFLGRRIELASDSITPGGCARVLSEVTGKAVAHRQVPLEDVRAQAGAATAKMFEWFEAEGYDVDLEEVRAEFPEVAWHDFEAWVREQDWSFVNPEWRGGRLT